MTDTCNAIIKKGSLRFICEKPMGHIGKGDKEHAQTTYTTAGTAVATTWTDSAMGGETVREV